jgi:hypothetical protein
MPMLAASGRRSFRLIHQPQYRSSI